ncbi:uncharacterized protein LOC114543418 [Dendronephthya gigantea]|uniref:uncharacterized protein LOC114543418 n=1 Tax=Dendronephthya gigantea TaxID=151771 RepID=UPI00106DA77B|nr:uncharacterized protein LOC114543418 [Dendronephthya gigantea]
MEPSKRQRNRITDAQRIVLERLYGNGMVGTGHLYQKVDQATQETGLTKTQVKKWIGNQKRKQPSTSQTFDETSTLKRAKHIKGPHSYNVFCSEFFKSDECKGLSNTERNKLAAERWNLQNEDEKKKYGETAKALSSVDIKVLDDEQKRKLIERHCKKLVEEIRILEDLGCQTSSLMINNEGTVFQLGSNEGNHFLSCNPDIGIKFREYFGSSVKKYRRNDVQDLFNKKYSEAVGKSCRVPYSKCGFRVVGLPEDISFKKPYNYGSLQLKKIMEAADKIKFIIEDPTLNEPLNVYPTAVSGNNGDLQGTVNVVKPLLVKIAGEDAAQRVLADSEKRIMEEEIEVVDLHLSDEEKANLYGLCEGYFSPDAWLAVGHNMQHSRQVENIVLPVHTTAEERFWLFRTNDKPLRIAKCVSSAKIRGQWLDLVDDDTYTFLHSDIITGKNLIRSAHGPLYFSIEEAATENFKLPKQFRFAIEGVLGKLRNENTCEWK